MCQVKEDLPLRVWALPEGRQRKHLLRQLDDYLIACHLSELPDPKRKAHWDKKAAQMERDLERDLTVTVLG